MAAHFAVDPFNRLKRPFGNFYLKSCRIRPTIVKKQKGKTSHTGNSLIQPERAVAAVKNLYEGRQCSSCGIRFTSQHLNASETSNYSKHLDWHFHSNRVKKSGKLQSRRWYFSVHDWINMEEGNDSENKGTNLSITIL